MPALGRPLRTTKRRPGSVVGSADGDTTTSERNVS
jgi:hypothetical protein